MTQGQGERLEIAGPGLNLGLGGLARPRLRRLQASMTTASTLLSHLIIIPRHHRHGDSHVTDDDTGARTRAIDLPASTVSLHPHPSLFRFGFCGRGYLRQLWRRKRKWLCCFCRRFDAAAVDVDAVIQGLEAKTGERTKSMTQFAALLPCKEPLPTAPSPSGWRGNPTDLIAVSVHFGFQNSGLTCGDILGSLQWPPAPIFCGLWNEVKLRHAPRSARVTPVPSSSALSLWSFATWMIIVVVTGTQSSINTRPPPPSKEKKIFSKDPAVLKHVWTCYEFEVLMPIVNWWKPGSKQVFIRRKSAKFIGFILNLRLIPYGLAANPRCISNRC